VKYLKMLGLAAVAAAALMAFVGAGTASADELCTTAAVSNMCPAGKVITEVDASLVGSAKLESTTGATLDTCTAGTVKITEINEAHGNKTGTSSIQGTVPAEDLTWGVAGTTPCTFPTKTITGGSIDATEAAGGGTTLTATGIEVTINTVLFGSCVYGVGAGLDIGSVANGGTQLVINKTVNRTGGGAACPETSVWNATYKITNHTAVTYINN
jgi:hypothetical protein